MDRTHLVAATGPVRAADFLGQLTLGFSLEWVPSLGVSLAFHMDGLSRLFLALILGIGAMVFLYAPGYLHGDSRLPRLMVLLICFMFAMIGAVTADDLVTLFLFWEATSVLLHAGGLRQRARRQSRCGTPGDAGHRRRRACAARRAAADPACGAGPAALGPAAARPRADRRPGLLGRRDAGDARRHHQVGPGALPRLAPRRDGSAHAGFRLSALGHHGQARRHLLARFDEAMGATLGGNGAS